MKKLSKALAICFALVLPAVAMAGLPQTGVKGTHHDFAQRAGFMTTQTPSGDGVTLDPTLNSVGLCSYCHTPHGASSTTLLWNHTLSANTFTWDDATTAGGTNYASITPSYKGPTVKCLSCHDGSVAVGDVGWYKEGPGVFNTLKVTGTDLITKTASNKLSGNHPVGMAYPFGQAKSTYNGTTTGNNVVLTEFQADPQTPFTPASVAAIKLYTDTGGQITNGATAGTSGLECSTCHDPHNKATVDDLLLRGKLAGSVKTDGYICLQCHIK
jgi:hypothetical protein